MNSSAQCVFFFIALICTLLFLDQECVCLIDQYQNTTLSAMPLTGLHFTLSHPEDARIGQACNSPVLQDIHRFSKLTFKPNINRSTRPSHCKACWTSWNFTVRERQTNSKIDPCTQGVEKIQLQQCDSIGYLQTPCMNVWKPRGGVESEWKGCILGAY